MRGYHLEGIYEKSVIDNISLISFVFLKKFGNLSVKIDALYQPNKTDQRGIKIEREEFNGEPILELHNKDREEQQSVFRQVTVIFPVTLQKFPNGRGSVKANWTSGSLLYLRRFKEAIVSYGLSSPIVKQMLNLWSGCRIIPNYWMDLVKGVI